MLCISMVNIFLVENAYVFRYSGTMKLGNGGFDRLFELSEGRTRIFVASTLRKVRRFGVYRNDMANNWGLWRRSWILQDL